MKPCKRCTVVQPLTAFPLDARNQDGRTGTCRLCANVRRTILYADDAPARRQKRRQTAKPATPEARQRMKDWRVQHAEELRQYFVDYYQEHRAGKLAYVKTYRHNNPDVDKNHSAKRRALKLAAPANDLTVKQWQEIKARYGYRCVYCGCKPRRLTQDHVTPLIKGGSHTVQNVVPACLACNIQKRDGAVRIPVQPLLLTLAPTRKKPRTRRNTQS